MAVFNKRDTLIKTISLMAVMSAINVIFSLMTAFAPFLSVALVIFLPLTSALVEFTCKDRYFPIYAFATLGLSIVVSLNSIDFTIFYVLPSIITGYIFGLMSKKNIQDFIGIFIAAIIQTGISFAFIPLIKLLLNTDQNLIEEIATILKINNRYYYDTFIILIFFSVSLIQVLLSYIVINNELKRLGDKKENKINCLLASSFLIGSLVISIFISFVYLPISYLFLGFTWFFAIILIVDGLQNEEKLFLVFCFSTFLISIFCFGILFKYFADGYGFLLLLISPFLISVLSFVFYFLKKKKG